MTDKQIYYISLFFLLCILSLLTYYIVRTLDMLKPQIVVVFDLDETLGSFTQLGVLKDVIENYEKRNLSQEEFNELVDKHQEFIRPGILEILSYVVKQRTKGYCDAIMIYTNNQGPKVWCETISKYFSYKIGTKVFDQIIAAFMIDGHRVEPGRTSHEKAYNDFIRCTRLPKTTEVCFIDDIEHSHMRHENVYYVNVKPYQFKMPISECLGRIYNQEPEKQLACLSSAQNRFHPNTLRGLPKTREEQEVDIVIGKFMLQHMHDFFATYKRKNKGTRRKTTKSHNRKTRHK